jgi:S-adenosylmethionine:tRNA ribosyltransferase-isomerase
MSSALTFELPEALEAREPPEHRGLARDEVRMMVARRHDRALVHARARDLPDFLAPGDLVVVNASATLPASVPGRRANGDVIELHLSTPMPGAQDEATWLVELRRRSGTFRRARDGETLVLPGGARAELITRYASRSRLWVASLRLPASLYEYLARHGRPISYRYVDREWPLPCYQTAFAIEPGSAEMPSAGRPLSASVVTALVARGIQVAPLVLHTGVSSLEGDEQPYPERYRVPSQTARLVNATRAAGGRVVAVGTTVVRALESVSSPDGLLEGGAGWTDLVVTAERGVRTVDGLLTGWHEPHASHLLMLEAIAGRDLVERSYRAALECGYLWHEFGDVELILP